ncbi:hypothetical protein M0812_23264 [Anaeramoeba flamelloides]|uniref:Dymeclin n=1 Tax=Anaeramoeba flamelloides TaxID=1746091 RepID=A0AAV7YQN8_9EUKA|nr:hypothetical protein M0812_23264 [Anaeramoeba flamelloides]
MNEHNSNLSKLFSKEFPHEQLNCSLNNKKKETIENLWSKKEKLTDREAKENWFCTFSKLFLNYLKVVIKTQKKQSLPQKKEKINLKYPENRKLSIILMKMKMKMNKKKKKKKKKTKQEKKKEREKEEEKEAKINQPRTLLLEALKGVALLNKQLIRLPQKQAQMKKENNFKTIKVSLIPIFEMLVILCQSNTNLQIMIEYGFFELIVDLFQNTYSLFSFVANDLTSFSSFENTEKVEENVENKEKDKEKGKKNEKEEEREKEINADLFSEKSKYPDTNHECSNYQIHNLIIVEQLLKNFLSLFKHLNQNQEITFAQTLEEFEFWEIFLVFFENFRRIRKNFIFTKKIFILHLKMVIFISNVQQKFSERTKMELTKNTI